MMRRSTALLAAALSLILTPVSATVLVAGDEEIPDTADFVIVGGGTAGCVLASRLCTDLPQASIVLLERGAPRNEAEDFYVTAPRFGDSIYANAGPEEVDVFNYFPSEPNSNLVDPATGMTGRIIDLIDGATIGGASNVAFQWTYPLSGTVDEWRINGLDTATANSLFERAAGVIGVAQPPPELRQDYVQDVLNAYAKANYTVKEEQIAGEGGYTAEVNFVTIDDAGRRRSSYTQYLLPALLGVCKQRLTVIQDVTVTKLVPSSEDRSKIDTVEYVSSSNPDIANRSTIKANHEILLSAGPYGSPKLLLLSGIGPRKDLESKGISPILADLPVGQRTQLRPLVPVVGRYSGRPLASVTNTSLLTEEAKQQFIAGEGGPFGVALTATLGKRDTLGYHSTGFGLMGAPNEPYFSMYCFLNPVGYGNLTIAEDADPLAEPIVHTDVLGDPQDFGAALQCAEEFRAIIEKGFPEDFGMSAFGPSSSIPTQNWVASTAITSWHFVGGSAVGSVVDGDFKVMGGLTGLRVIDSSVIPKLTVSAGVLSSVYMLAEFASDKLVQEYSSSFVSIDAAEPFPFAFALVMLCVSVLFSMWVIVRNTCRSAQEEEIVVRPQLMRKSSWVANSVQRLLSSRRSSSSTKIPAMNDGVEGEGGLDGETTAMHASVPQDKDTTASSTEPSALLSWAQVTCSYPGSKAYDKHVTSLHNSFGEMRATELTAIMGGSGSGKSTLLDILSGRKTLGNIAGKLSVHGEVLDDIRAQAMDEGGALRSVAAYVPQQEAFFPTQTAEEAVAFVANLKLGRDPRGDQVRWSRIQSVLREVGLRLVTLNLTIAIMQADAVPLTLTHRSTAPRRVSARLEESLPVASLFEACLEENGNVWLLRVLWH
jgi:choline dehydrogenase-like flavoprotein